MSVKDYNKQVEKRQRIRETTLVVGVDIGNAFNAVGYMNKAGKVLGSCAKLYNNRKDFEQFVDMTERLKARRKLAEKAEPKDPAFSLYQSGWFYFSKFFLSPARPRKPGTKRSMVAGPGRAVVTTGLKDVIIRITVEIIAARHPL